MLRPERMSRVSITGSKRVMEDAVEAIHDLNLLDLSEYDESWEGFEPGDPTEGAEEASEKLVTVRSLESILDLDEDDAGPTREVSDEEIEERLEEIRTEVNDLDDRRSALRDDLREVEEEIAQVEPFADLGIDLDLLGGYDSLAVAVGQGDVEEVRRAVADLSAPYEVYAGDDMVAAFARTDEEDLQEALVGVEFTAVEVPEGEGSPEEYLEELQHERRRIEQEIESVESQLEEIKLDAAGFLLAVEEQLSVRVQKAEAPLRFATTENAFVAEGWIPSDRYTDLVDALQSAVGDHVEVAELERADYDRHGHPEESEPVVADEGQDEEVVADGGEATMGDEEPPVVLDNPGPIKPIELLVETVGRPRYTEFDPTWLLFLTFPVFFGYMIGDVAYGLGYAGVGYLMMTRVDSEGIQKLGGIGVWCGAFTVVFGILYGEFLGLHSFGELIWGVKGKPASGLIHLGHPPIKKGLTATAFAKAWMLVTLFVGLLHVTVGHVLSFVKDYRGHGLEDAVFESGSWIVLMFGVWGWVFTVLPNLSPSLFADTLGPQGVLPVGFMGLPDALNYPFVGVIAVGFVMLVIGEGVQSVEVLQTLVNVLSYMRLMAVLLAKAGMAFVVNLFAFGLYEHEGEMHYLTFGDPSHGHVIFQGLLNMQGGATAIIAFLFGLVLIVIGHLVVFGLGITSAGLQAMRLEYVEFFGKFYDGGGRRFDPFGYRRQYTREK